MQQFLRQQQNIDISKSINLIQYACYKFSVFNRFLNKYSIKIGKIILDFLIESIQGPCT